MTNLPYHFLTRVYQSHETIPLQQSFTSSPCTTAQPTKEAIAFSQMNRALRVSRTSTGSSQGMKITEMFEKNDYPIHTIEKSKKRGRENRTQNQYKNVPSDGLLRLPYISDGISRKVRKNVKKSGLNIHVA